MCLTQRFANWSKEVTGLTGGPTRSCNGLRAMQTCENSLRGGERFARATLYDYTALRGTTRRASPDRRLAIRYGSPTLSEGVFTQARQTKPSMGSAILGGHDQLGRDPRNKEDIENSRLRVGFVPQTGEKTRGGAPASAESREDHAAVRRDVSRIRGTALRAQFSPHAETLNPKEVPFNLQDSFAPCLRFDAALRNRSARLAALCTGQVARWPQLGILRSVSQPHVEAVHSGKAVELLRGRKSGFRGNAAGEDTRAGKTCLKARADSRATQSPARTLPHHGASRFTNRNADRGNSWSALEGSEPDRGRPPCLASDLSWHAEYAKDQRQPAASSSSSLRGPDVIALASQTRR